MKESDLTVIFITLNEEFHIGAAIDNVKSIAKDIFVVDSLSVDKTVDVALEKGAKVVQRPFTNFGDQWNFALEKLPIRTKWTMKMDPDERLSDELKDEIRQALENPGSVTGFEFDRILWFMGRCLPGWRDSVVRIWKTNACRFTNIAVNEHPLVDGRVRRLHHVMNHLDSQDLYHWFKKQNEYLPAEAIRRYKGEALADEPKFWGTKLQRHMWFKKVFFKLPFRYTLMFFQLYFGKGLWKLGMTGLWCVRMRIWARQSVECAVQEMKNTGRLISLPKRDTGDYHPAVAASDLQRQVCGGNC